MAARSSVFSPPSCPTDIAALSVGERLVLQGLRRWIMGWERRESWHWSVVWNEFAKSFGPARARDGLTAMSGLVRELAVSARRPFRYAPACCATLSADEITVLCLVAACQRGDPDSSSRLAEWLVQPTGAAGLIDASNELALVMQDAGLNLPDRKSKIVRQTEARPEALRGRRLGGRPVEGKPVRNV